MLSPIINLREGGRQGESENFLKTLTQPLQYKYKCEIFVNVHNPLSISMNHIINVVGYEMLSNILTLSVDTCVFAEQGEYNVYKVDPCTQ